MKKLSFIILILSSIVHAQDCNDRVEVIFNNLINSIGDYSM